MSVTMQDIAKELTIGMAVYDDFDGVVFSVMSLILHHGDEFAKIVVVDNNPDSAQGKAVASFCGTLPDRVTYSPLVGIRGTAAPRNHVFDKATTKYVMCMDPHVLYPLYSIRALLSHLRDNPETKDLLQGPLLYENGGLSTHFNGNWGGEMWGQWDTNHEGLKSGKPFDIPSQGLGMFASQRETWLRFNHEFTGFGGEEGYIHEKYRQHGRRCLCIPSLHWWHRFTRPNGTPYPALRYEKVRNYIIGFKELKLSLTPIYDHFVLGKGLEGGKGVLSELDWKVLLNGDMPAPGGVVDGCNKPDRSCGQQPERTVLEWYKWAAETPSDINEHVPTLRELAKGKDTVVEFGVRTGVSTAGLLAGRPKKLISYDLNPSPQAQAMMERAKEEKMDFEFKVGDSLQVEIPECDLLFIDTKHTADHVFQELMRHGNKAKRIAFHDTEIFGENGEDGGPGLMVALRGWLMQNKEWKVVRHDKNNHGFTVISRLEDDKPKLPSTARQALNFIKATTKHKLNGGKLLPLPLAEERMKECLICPERNDDRCSKCGCYLFQIPEGIPVTGGNPGKTFYPADGCPLGKWGPNIEASVDMTPAEVETMLVSINI